MKRILTILFLCFVPVVLFAQIKDAVEATPPLNPETTNFITNLVSLALMKFPIVTTIVALIGSMRVWAKPVFGLIHAITDITPTKWDDGLWARFYTFFTETPTGRTLAWLLDYLASVKLVKPEKKL